MDRCLATQMLILIQNQVSTHSQTNKQTKSSVKHIHRKLLVKDYLHISRQTNGLGDVFSLELVSLLWLISTLLKLHKCHVVLTFTFISDSCSAASGSCHFLPFEHPSKTNRALIKPPPPVSRLKTKTVSPFTQPHVVPHLFEFLLLIEVNGFV